MKQLPEVSLAFWITKIAATPLGETAGDLFAQTLKLRLLPHHDRPVPALRGDRSRPAAFPPLQPVLLLDSHPVDQHRRHPRCPTS
ncbi:hypothetical protein [Streptomyces sp. NPDC056628]|uniref:hypothetical protein n=1 Tax=Streptomyces sp. NPDC056628 TaxID=3345882 RepID=UPI003680C1E0